MAPCTEPPPANGASVGAPRKCRLLHLRNREHVVCCAIPAVRERYAPAFLVTCLV